jgi:hypothetical protein
MRVEVLGFVDELIGQPRAEQIKLLEEVEELVRRPFRVVEAPVVGGGAGDRRRRLAGEPFGRRGP